MAYALNEGDRAPNVEVPQHPEGMFSPAAHRGHWLVLYFYPKDNTPGCTNEAIAFRDHWPEFQRLGAAVVGASRDSLRSHARFAEKYQLPFPLASDPEEALCQAFDVIRLKKMYGREVRGIERSTFLIDPEGVVRKAWRKVKVAGHVEAVLQALKELAAA